MVNTIKIFNPRDYPFGKLSINNKDDFYLNNKLYPSVSNYIYSNLLRTPLFKQVIQNIKISELEKEFNILLSEEINTIVKKAIETGLDSKINDSKEMQESLLSTKNEPISYISSNPITGIGDDSNGLNMVGKYLEQKRRQIEISFKEQYTEKKKQEWEHALYESYIADLALNKAIKNGNDLSEYMGKTPTQIIDMIGRTEVVNSAPSKKFIVEDLYKKQRYKNLIPKEIILSIDNPESLVFSIRKKQLGNLRKRQITLRKETVLYMYCEYILEKEFDIPKEKYDEAIKEQYLKYGWDDNSRGMHSKLDLANKVYDLYEKEMFSERLSTNIDNALAAIIVPTENEVIQAEVYIIPTTKKEEANILPYQKPTGKPIYIYEEVDKNEKKFEAFSLLDSSKMMTIGLLDLVYPTILHYMYVALLANLPDINNIKDAYQYIIADNNAPLGLGRFESPDTVQRKYLNEKTERMNTKKQKLAEEGLNAKFSNRAMQDLLLDTKNDILIWNNFNDSVLGIGKKGQGGMNIVGRYMMQIRTAITEERKSETFDKLSDKDINNLLERDSLVHAWLEMRVKDMCKAIITVKNYKYYKTKENVKIDADFVKYVLDNIYQPCADVFAASSEIKLEAPIWFKNIVYSCPGFSNKKKDDQEQKESKPKQEDVDMDKILQEELDKAFADMDDDEIIIEEEKPVKRVLKRPVIAGKRKYKKVEDDQVARLIDKEANDEFIKNLLNRPIKKNNFSDTATQKKSSSFPIGKDVIDVLWKRIAVMIYYLIKYLKETTIQNVRRVLIVIEQLTSKEKPCEKIINGTLDNCIVSAILNILQNLIDFNKKYSLKEDIEKIDIETAVSIILNKDMKGLLELRPEIFPTKIDVEQDDEDDEDEDEDEDDDPYKNIYDDLEDGIVDLDEDDLEEDLEYDEDELEEDEIEDEIEDEFGEGLEEDDFGDIFSPSIKNNLITKLSDMPEVKDVEDIYLYIMSAVEIVKTQKMSKNIKINRINFFATQK
jgi:predicted NAD-dependent protein-ADP-ribosyltransferase YbiA (DUF1768 family)